MEAISTLIPDDIISLVASCTPKSCTSCCREYVPQETEVFGGKVVSQLRETRLFEAILGSKGSMEVRTAVNEACGLNAGSITEHSALTQTALFLALLNLLDVSHDAPEHDANIPHGDDAPHRQPLAPPLASLWDLNLLPRELQVEIKELRNQFHISMQSKHLKLQPT